MRNVRVHRVVDDLRAVDAGKRREVAGEGLEVTRGLYAELGVGADGRLQPGRRVERQELAVVDDRDALAELVGFVVSTIV